MEYIYIIMEYILEKNLKKNIYIYIYIYIYICTHTYKTESLCPTPETNTTLLINYTSV